jgi:transcription elongation factor GreA
MSSMASGPRLEWIMDGPRLSEEARRSLEERLRVLEADRIPRLEREVGISGDVSIAAALRGTQEEATRVREALASATPLEEEEHDPTVVELGDTVTVRQGGSRSRERFTLAGELESRLDESWVSVEAPLGSALLGARVGESVEVSTPEGPVLYEVLGIERGT